MLIKHVRDFSRRPHATIVALSPSQIGIAYCNTKDIFNKKTGVDTAKERAIINECIECPNHTLKYYAIDDCIVKIKLRDLIEAELENMKDRAKRYFK